VRNGCTSNKRSKNFFAGGTQNRVLFLLTKSTVHSRAFAQRPHQVNTHQPWPPRQLLSNQPTGQPSQSEDDTAALLLFHWLRLLRLESTIGILQLNLHLPWATWNQDPSHSSETSPMHCPTSATINKQFIRSSCPLTAAAAVSPQSEYLLIHSRTSSNARVLDCLPNPREPDFISSPAVRFLESYRRTRRKTSD
jgi:hypothetical protein